MWDGRFYFDHAATTPLHPRAREAMREVLDIPLANPASTHTPGRAARALLERARNALAERLAVDPKTLMFTSGATEANVTALYGALRAQGKRRRRVISTPIEHASLKEHLHGLSTLGYDVAYVEVDEKGLVDLASLDALLSDDTALVIVIGGHNELGTIQPLQAIAERTRRAGAYLHVDAVQMPASRRFTIPELRADYLTLSAHKVGGPVGTGLLYVASNAPFEPLFKGGEQEGGRRSGTQDVIGAVGFAAALEALWDELDVHVSRYHTYADIFMETFRAEGLNVVKNGADDGLAHILNVSLMGVPADLLLVQLDLKGVYLSRGSACRAGIEKPSEILKRIGLPEARVKSAVRISFGPTNDVAAVEQAAQIMSQVARAFKYV
ncbi:MAG: cysteine desulfurase family protein [Candidatus Carbobacillus sp.]|nr:cysteine desulfurase family protein [Candidatus Carbobacillus sp.]